MELNDYRAKIKGGQLGGVYIFAGEEDYLKRYYLGELRTACLTDESFAVFNHAVFDGKDIDFAAVGEAVKSPPMMSEYKLIEWHHADFTAMNDKEFGLFFDLCALVKEYPYAAVAFITTPEGFEANSKKKKASNQKKAQDETCFLLFNKSTDNQLFSWLKKHFEANGVSVTLDTLKTLLFHSGRSMDVLEKEVKKISYMVLARGERAATPGHVEEVASSTPECETFAFSNAIGERNRELAFAALEEMKFRRVDPGVILSMMSKSYSELSTVSLLLSEGGGQKDVEEKLGINKYRVPHLLASVKRYGKEQLSEIMCELARIDAASKFGGIAGYTAIELFVATYL